MNESGTIHADGHDGVAGDAAVTRNCDPVEAARKEFRDFFSDVQLLIQQVERDADPAVAQLRSKVQAKMASAKQALADGQSRISGQARKAAQQGGHYVRDHPWRSVGVAALAGLLVGIVINRR